MMVGAYHPERLARPPARPEYLFLVSRAEVQQRLRRARWIANEGLSAPEAAYIPLDYDPDPPQ